MDGNVLHSTSLIRIKNGSVCIIHHNGGVIGGAHVRGIFCLNQKSTTKGDVEFVKWILTLNGAN